MRVKTFALLVALGLPVVLSAQAIDTLSLTGRSSINLGFGLTGVRDASVTPNGASTHTSGEAGSIGFMHWVRPEVAVSIGASVLSADASAVNSGAHANAVTALLVGVSYAPSALALTRSLRPYVSAAAGPYMHTAETAGALSASSTTETVAGARLAGGINWFAARHFMMAFEGNYNAVGSFDRPDTPSSKPSGFGMSLTFGVSWGGR